MITKLRKSDDRGGYEEYLVNTDTYIYDYENRLVRKEGKVDQTNVNSWGDYTYNGDGQLMGISRGASNYTYYNNEYYQYDGKQAIADLDGANAVIANYTWLPGSNLLSVYKERLKDRDNYYIFSDVLGTPILEFGQTNEFTDCQLYDVFGAISGSNVSRFAFTGAPYFDGLYQMGARYYNPQIGRFITRDTYRGDIYKPWTQNLYTYCNNNPVNYVDPTGHFAETVVDVGFLAYDLSKIVRNPTNKENWKNAGIDLGCTLLPIVNVPMVKGGIKILDEGADIIKGAGNVGAARRLTYEASPKHGSTARGSISAAPRNGQEALDLSIQVKSTSPRRVGIDYKTGEFNVFDQTSQVVFHGHVRSWDQLTAEMQRTLRQAGMVDSRGRILGGQ